MANQLRGMAIAGFGATILAACPLGALAPSVKLFMAAGVVYLLGEITAGKKQKGEIEGENKEVEGTLGGQGGETQLATLEAQLKDKEEKKKVADKRAMFTAASMALMAAAAIAAAMEIPREAAVGTPAYLPPLGCNTGTALASAKPKAAMIGAAFAFLASKEITSAVITGVGIYMLGLSAMVGIMNLAAGRVKAFGAMAAFTGLALMDAKKESGRLAKEIEDLKKVIAQFRLETDDPGDQTEDVIAGTTGGVTTGPTDGVTTSGVTSGVTSGTGPGTPVNPLPDGTVVTTRTCMSSTAISSNCTNPLRVPSVNLSGFAASPELQQVASNGVGLANDLASGSAAGKADIAAASLASSATKMNDQLKNQIAKSNAFLKSKGQKAIDFDKEVADTMKSMNSAFQNEGSKSGQNLASLGIGNTTLDPNAAAKAAQEIGAASANSAIAVPTSDGKAADTFAPYESTTAITAEAGKAAEESAASALGKNLGDYESNAGDISDRKEESLWKQVSNRYLLNYGRFFERNKLPSQ